eukprot:TRINITY_DN2286_c1_g5_i2.p4 TRINITY_DN2286_c1_g5~~TRINITY_DN2286_c1_g5_i2.p4  ORF type:complete len:109 (-),score=0.35 TRINITY_DN2286_c1_g5_i2:3975-4301(-)
MRKLDLRFRVSDGLQGVAVNSVSVIISVLASKMEYFGYFSNSAKLFGVTFWNIIKIYIYIYTHIGIAVNFVSVIISVLASKMEYFGYFSNSAKLFGATFWNIIKYIYI